MLQTSVFYHDLLYFRCVAYTIKDVQVINTIKQVRCIELHRAAFCSDLSQQITLSVVETDIVCDGTFEKFSSPYFTLYAINASPWRMYITPL